MNYTILPFQITLIAACIAATTLFSAPALSYEERPHKEGLLSIEEILITGSRFKRAEGDLSNQLVTTFDHLSDKGNRQLSDILLMLPSASGSHIGSDGINEIALVGVNFANLRGIGETATLVMLNSRRQTRSGATTSGGGQGTDLNSLVPAIAIDRIETLKSGASSIYGADAVAGVLNVITQKNYIGTEVRADYLSSGYGQTDSTLSMITGNNIENITYMFAASYFDRTPLSARDVRNEYEKRNAISIFGQPGTFLIDGIRTPDPNCAVVAQSNPDTTTSPGAVGFCEYDFGDYFRLINEEKQTKLHGEMQIDLNDNSKLFFEVGYANNEIVSTTSPSQPILFPQLVPVNNPGNFAGKAILQLGRVLGTGSAPSEIDVESETIHMSAGLKLQPFSKWTLDGLVSYSENNYDYYDTSDTAIDRYKAALNGQGGPIKIYFITLYLVLLTIRQY